MAITYPLPLTFFQGLPVASAVFDLPTGAQQSRTRGGEVVRAEVSARLWTGKITLAPRLHSDAVRIAAQIELLRGAAASFFVHPYPLWAPAADPGGVILGASTPTLHTATVATGQIRITGLPAGYQLRTGDFLSFTVGSSPTRTLLHRLVEDATADGAGLTPLVTVTPALHASTTTGGAVTLVRPVCKAVLVGGDTGASGPGVTQGITLDFVQTLR